MQLQVVVVCLEFMLVGLSIVRVVVENGLSDEILWNVRHTSPYVPRASYQAVNVMHPLDLDKETAAVFLAPLKMRWGEATCGAFFGLDDTRVILYRWC